MSQNSIDYIIYEIIHVKEGQYESPCAWARTAKKARKIAATIPEAIIKKYRWTPCHYIHKNWGKPKKDERKQLRSLRKDARHEADTKKREDLDTIWFINIPCGERVAQRMSVRQFSRYLAGVRKGAIL